MKKEDIKFKDITREIRNKNKNINNEEVSRNTEETIKKRLHMTDEMFRSYRSLYQSKNMHVNSVFLIDKGFCETEMFWFFFCAGLIKCACSLSRDFFTVYR